MSRIYAQVVLFDAFDPLDVIAPFEVLAAGSDAVGRELELRLVSAEGPRIVRSGTRDLELTATHRLDPSLPGVIIVPGAAGPIEADPDEVDTIPVLLARASATGLPDLIADAFSREDVLVATVCGGSLVLALAGIIEGRSAVTHRQGMEVLAATGVNAVRSRVVDDGNLVSAGGVTSGLDLGVYLLERMYGPRVAHQVEELFEFERRGTVWQSSGRVPVQA
jgi:transcriptional regulator GlxA family with amidase domain